MKSKDIRQSFIDFFRDRDHKLHESAPLVPHGDPTLLFTNAGMVQFKAFFLGTETPDHPRAVTSQKCLRVSGKHNDLENVGPSPRHHTFFEMLGNFSFGDYFKEDAIRFGWDLVTEGWGISPERLFATVFEEDDEAFDLWVELSGLPPERVLRCGAKDNFWAMGDTGPCGPCSEIFVDLHPERPPADWEEGTESGRYLEIWNLVFMQFDRREDGEMKPLPKPSVDTGAGLERLAAVLQGVESNYDTDLFQPILRAVAELCGTPYGKDADRDVAMRVIADHLRAVTFLLADGVIPGNEGRGYVLRRILRRAVRHGMRLGFEEPFLHRLPAVLEEVMGEAYPELGATRAASVATLEAEEEKFLSTVATGARQVQEEIEEAKHEGRDRLPGGAVFRLYDTFGLPLEVIREITDEEQLGLDEEGFEEALAAQRKRSREATGEGQKRVQALQQTLQEEGLGETRFEGYRNLELSGARVQRIVRQTDGGPVVASGLQSGEEGVVVLDRTVFYAESGGQVGDRGRLRWDGGGARVTDTQKEGGVYFHFVEVTEGRLQSGQTVDLEVEESLRRPTQRNHTATHLLHAALRQVLGEGVRQAGSLVAPDRLRFDFTYSKPVTPEELREIESRVNRWILAARDTEVVAERDQKEALAAGAMALFGEKYGDKVRTVEIPGVSLELCGGCHVGNTGEIGPFLITAERGIASGVRRIEAITGEAALEHIRRRDERLRAVEEHLGVPAERLVETVEALRDEVRTKDRELSRLRMKLVAGDVSAEAGNGDQGAETQEVDGVRVLIKEVPWAPAGELRNMADMLRGKLGSGLVVVGSRGDGKVSLVAAASDDLKGRVHAGKLVGELARRVGGGGGGRPDFATAGGREPDKLPAALEAVPEVVRGQLGG